MASNQLLQFKEEESMLLLQLQKIEKQSLNLHENVRTRMYRTGIHKEALDIIERKSELVSMAQELSEKVEGVRARIEQAGREQIIREYGEGPVKVILEVDFSDSRNRNSAQRDSNAAAMYPRIFQPGEEPSFVTILLWPETPHSAWTWLEQIRRHVWDGASFRWDPNEPLLELSPIKGDPLKRGQLQFEEYHNTPHWHTAWSVGVRNSDDGKLQMTLDLSDNFDSKDTCIGRVIDGYDALQRLFESTNQNGEFTFVRVKRVNAMHMTHLELSNVER